MIQQTKTENQTIGLGKKLAKNFKGGEVIILTGQLGSGKTVLTKGIAQGLKSKNIVNSPTFVLMKIYQTARPPIKQLVHIDCYRLPDPDQLAAIGITEYFNRPDTVTIIEWGEKIKSLLPKKYLTIKIEILKNNLRKITVK